MLGGFVAATNLVKIESVEKGTRFALKKMSDKILESNLEAIHRAYEEVKNAQS
jgi:Pyruvate/2-oxoacid:ferredoxin oxidoreductase gamma subunit